MKNTEVIMKWDEASEAWLSSLKHNTWRNKLLLPILIDLLGDVRNKRIIDIGCGEGEYSRRLAEKGADVLGIDGSPNLIQAAKERSQTVEGKLQFEVYNASHLDGIENESFDIVLSAMCLMALIEFHEAIIEMARVLKPQGRVVISTIHPCFSGPNSQINQDNGEILYNNSNYFAKGWFEDQLSKALGKSLPIYHRTLQDIIMPFINTGFTMRRIIEPQPSDRLQQEFPSTVLLSKIPLFIIFDFEKLE